MLVGRMHTSAKESKDKSHRDVCPGKIQPKCQSILNSVISEINSSVLLAASFVTDRIPYLNMDIPDDTFIGFVSRFLISPDGFSHKKDVLTELSMAIGLDLTTPALLGQVDSSMFTID